MRFLEKYGFSGSEKDDAWKNMRNEYWWESIRPQLMNQCQFFWGGVSLLMQMFSQSVHDSLEKPLNIVVTFVKGGEHLNPFDLHTWAVLLSNMFSFNKAIYHQFLFISALCPPAEAKAKLEYIPSDVKEHHLHQSAFCQCRVVNFQDSQNKTFSVMRI